MLKLRWSFFRPEGLTQWYGHVQRHHDRIVGQWFVLDAQTGELLWEAEELGRPNTIVGIDGDVIVATQMRFGGPWTAEFGGWGLELQTGEVRWEDQDVPARGGLAGWLERAGLLGRRGADAPTIVVDGRVFTREGRVLDARTGALLGEGEPVPEATPSSPLASTLFTEGAVEVSDGRLVRVAVDGPGRLRLSVDGGVVYEADGQERWVHGDYYGYRLHESRPWLAVVERDGPAPPGSTRVARHTLRLVGLDGANLFEEEVPAGQPCWESRIEWLDDEVLLVSADRRWLFCYEVAQSEAMRRGSEG